MNELDDIPAIKMAGDHREVGATGIVTDAQCKAHYAVRRRVRSHFV
jgi:hypothetical protein